MLKDFVAIDFETANMERSSVCAVGLVMVRDGQFVDSYYSLIQPEPNYYSYRCTQVHGLCRQDTDGAPVFPYVWEEAMLRIGRYFSVGEDEESCDGLPPLTFVAHNSPFDEGCLKAVCRVYRIDYPDFPFLCTCRASRRVHGKRLPNHQLHTVAEACGYCLENHHHALADAEACAWIAREIL